MSNKSSFTSPYGVVISRYVTEKSILLQELCKAEGSPSLSRCKKPKYVFLVNSGANKKQIAEALETIYSDRKIKVSGVNTVRVKPKPKRVRGKNVYGKSSGFKKAIVTLGVGDSIE